MIPSFYCLVSLWCSFMPNAGVLPDIATAALTCRTNIKRMPKKCQLVFGNDANLIEIPTRRVLTFFFYFFGVFYIHIFLSSPTNMFSFPMESMQNLFNFLASVRQGRKGMNSLKKNHVCKYIYSTFFSFHDLVLLHYAKYIM